MTDIAPTAPQAPNWRATFRKITNSSAVTVVLAIVVALVVGAILIAAADEDVQRTVTYLFAQPGDFFVALGQSIGGAYAALFQGAVVNFGASSSGAALLPLARTVANSVPLIFAGLALGMGFRAGLFNIGGQGQIMLGAVFCSYLGFALHLPVGLHVIVCVLGAFVGGAIWGFVPGILKATTGANEVIVTIMLNSIAGFLLGFLLTLQSFRVPGSNNPISPMVDANALYPTFFGTPVSVGFVLAIAAAVGVWWLMERSTLGFRIKAVGANKDAALTSGMNVRTTYIWVMTIGGGLCGLAATAPLLGTPSQALSVDIASTFGFDAITVALLGRSKPLGTVLAGLLFGGLRAGGYMMQAGTGVPIDIILVLQSVIVLLIAAPPLVKAIFRLPDPSRRHKVRRARGMKASVARSEVTA
ncbi:MAG: ABC transporter permease [Propionibacteriaceae bacterium]|jgi:simple sugar transport system permease protein|nr:ABC transporter permease [Propionibacteriaceae bacterium]